MKNKTKIVAVVGPTASGKTGLAIRLAKQFHGEVISADSRQVYRGLDIGTAKVTAAEAKGIPHHLLDIADIDTSYTATQFVTDATKVIDTLHSNNVVPILAGGTFFYLDILRGKITTAPVAPNQAFRAQAETRPTAELQQELQQRAPQQYEHIDTNNRRRLIRALEIIQTLGYIPDTTENDTAHSADYEWYMIGLHTEKEVLRHRYQERAQEWLHAGLLKEVDNLLQKGVTRDRLQEIGFEYTLTLSLLEKEITEAEFIEKFIQKNWQYAKRQLTWLKRDKFIHWYTADQEQEIYTDVTNFLN